jgi:methylenetetrahydrofolate--tRNA-(uracil-5-)-methyltransferase
MRPIRQTPAHQTDLLAELVCSNSFKSVETTNAHGLLKAEMRRLGSVVLPAADAARVPGGAALAVDRSVFSRALHERVSGHPLVTLVREEVTELPSPAVVATGPLTSDKLSEALAGRVGSEALAFYDAIAPIVADESLDHDVLFLASWPPSSPPTSTSRRTTSTASRTSRAVFRWKKWPGADRRRCVSVP